MIQAYMKVCTLIVSAAFLISGAVVLIGFLDAGFEIVSGWCRDVKRWLNK